MNMKIFSVFDSKAKFYLQPFHSRNVSTAVREFAVAVQDEGSMFNRHPEDFVLVELGEFDEIGGRLIGLPNPLPVCTAESLMRDAGGQDE